MPKDSFTSETCCRVATSAATECLVSPYVATRRGCFTVLADARRHETGVCIGFRWEARQAICWRQSCAWLAQPQPGAGNRRQGNYKPSRYLAGLDDLRNDFTVVSGTSHPGVSGGHSAEGSIFSACPNARGSASRNTISLDQLMAKHSG